MQTVQMPMESKDWRNGPMEFIDGDCQSMVLVERDIKFGGVRQSDIHESLSSTILEGDNVPARMSRIRMIRILLMS